FLAALADLLDVAPAEAAEELEPRVVARRDQLAGADPSGYLRLLLDHAGIAALLVDTGAGGDKVLKVAELERAAARPPREPARLEPVAEELLAPGAPTARSLTRLVAGFEERVGLAMERGAVALKSIASARGGLWLFTETTQADRRRAFTNLDKAAQAERFDDAVLLPFLGPRAAELAGTRQVPLQFATGVGDEDVYLPHADPALLWPMLRDARTEDSPGRLRGSYPSFA